MSMLVGLFQAALGDPALTRVRDLARGEAARADGLDLTAPPALRPFVVAAVAAVQEQGGADRPVLAVTATSREAEDLAAALGGLLPPEQVAVYPAWETLPHERLSPRSDTVGRRLAVLRRLAHPGDRGERRCAAGGRRPGPFGVAAAAQGARRPGAGAVRRRGRGWPGADRPAADRSRLYPGGSGHQTGRIRRPRRHPGHFPAHRRASVPDRVLGRRGGGDPYLRRRGPAHHRGGAGALGAALPGTATHPAGTAARRRPGRGASGTGRDPRQARRGDPGRGDGIARPGPVDRNGRGRRAPSMELLLHCMPAETHVLLCDPERIRTRAHDLVRTSAEFLEASWAAAAVGGQAPIDLGAAAFRTLAEVRSAAGELAQPWWSLSPFGLVEAESAADEAPWLDDVASTTVTPDAGEFLAVTAAADPALPRGDRPAG